MDNIESFEAGDNCVSFFQIEGMSEEEATTFCSGGEYNGSTLKEALNKGYINLEELKTNNVIKNVVITGTITITDYDINIGGIDVVIPSTIDGKPVVAIGYMAFKSKKLSTETSLLSKGNIQFMSNKEDNEIASTVKSIGRNAFVYNQLTNVVIESIETQVDCTAFNGNNNLTIIKQGGLEKSISAYICGNE